MILSKRGELEMERRSNRSHSVENSVWEKLWACLKQDYGMDNTTKSPVHRKDVNEKLQYEI
jgi:hypothetical protein